MNVTAPAETLYIYCKEDLLPHDENDQCFKATLASYEILGQNGDTDGGPRIEFLMKPFNMPVIFKNHLGQTATPPANCEVEALVVQLAIESVLKRLHASECVAKELVTFQYRRGDTITPANLPSSIFAIPLTANAKTDYKLSEFLNFLDKGIISRTYAYLNKRKVCFYLNDDLPATVTKIKTVLNPLFN